MKQVNSVATSQAAAVPWIANKATATSACSSLGGTYRLPTNAEWNAAALEIYNEATNWTGGAKLSGTLYTGMYSAWTAPVAVTNTSNPYDSTGTASGVERRTFTLASGNTIWDFGGNAWEWVSDTIYGNSFTPDLSSNGPFKYWYDSYQFPQSSAQMLKFTGMTTVPDSIDYRLGNFFGGSSGLVIRGGAAAMNNAGVVGIFTANIGDITANELRAPASWSLQMDNVGFRCVATPGQY
jgi:formylglycine-generating enzyme required for sulfatase activity